MMIMVGSNNQPRPASGHYGSPHLQYLDRPSAHSTPSPPQHYAQLPHLSQQPPPPPPIARSAPTSYPSPASYPSPSMTAYPYPPPQQQPPPPTSRGSPYSQPATINLPPIRLAPPPNHQLPPPHEVSSLPGSPLPPPTQSIYSGSPYYQSLPPPAVPHAQITSSPSHHSPRYPLPSVSNPERIMSGGRHKKEIKRRTKTGCLTCRKRRIKCDEGHPTCKNCQKSKRDCLGYDPIFKSQPQGPAAIQPAPSAGGQGSPGSYVPMSSIGQAYNPALSTASSRESSCDTFDGYPPVDPALDATSHPQPPQLMDPYGHRPDLKRALDRTSPFSSASEATRAPFTPVPRSSTPGGGVSYAESRNGNPAKRIKIDDLLSVGSGQPLSPPASELAAVPTSTNGPAQNPIDSMKNIYRTVYAPSLDHFLEVNWFANKGYEKMWADHALAEVMGDLFERLKARGGSYVDEEDPTIQKSGWETDLLWAAVKMCYGTRIPVSDTRRDDRRAEEHAMNDAGDRDGAEASRRIAIVERILAGSSSEYTPPSPTPAVNGQAKDSSPDTYRFWDLLDEISRFNETGPDSEQKIRELLTECDRLSRGWRNCAVLYHIAELRHLNPNSPEDKRRAQSIRDYLTGLANDRQLEITSLERRIAGRAMGLWDQPVPDMPFCISAV